MTFYYIYIPINEKLYILMLVIYKNANLITTQRVLQNFKSCITYLTENFSLSLDANMQTGIKMDMTATPAKQDGPMYCHMMIMMTIIFIGDEIKLEQ